MNIFFSINDDIKCYFFERKKSYYQYYFLVTDFKEKIMFKCSNFEFISKKLYLKFCFSSIFEEKKNEDCFSENYFKWF